MDNGHDMLQLCRLCLVKDDVNIPIFQEHDDNSEIFVKISSCLPVKLERNDKLPQNICDSCFSKLDVVYDLWTTSSNSDKQLHKWLYEAEAANAKEKRLTKASNKSGDAIVKQEKIDDAHETVTYVEEVPWDGASSSAGPSASLTAEDEPPPKRARRAAAVKASITVAAESDDDDDDDNGPMTKMEDDSDEDDPTFGDVPSTSADDQPGPSGVGKDGSEAPDRSISLSDEELDIKPNLDILPELKLELQEFQEHCTRPLYMSCDVCGKLTRSNYDLWSHIDTHMQYSWCEICNIIFKKLLDLVIHKRLHSKDNLFVCVICKMKTDNINEIKQHFKEFHAKKLPRKYDCKRCNKKFYTLSTLKEHDNEHSGLKPFPCDLCNKKFPYSCLLYAHKDIKHKSEVEADKKKPFICVYCNKEYQNRRSMHEHLNQHIGLEFICEVCGKKFRSRDRLRIHIRTHTGEKPYSCIYCNKSFIIKTRLDEHIRIHTGEKPYICQFCQKGFSQRSSLVIHTRGHTGEKPYVCHICKKGFMARGMLTIHLKCCSGPE